jgi:hypothetical protein
VATLERKPRFVVIEFGGLLPIVHPVTVPAAPGRELISMGVRVHMAGPAFATQTQVRPVEVEPLDGVIQHQGIHDVLGIVAIPTCHGLVGPFQGISGQRMGKGVGIHPDQVEVQTEVLLVAAAAVLFIGAPVEPDGCIDPGLDGL